MNIEENRENQQDINKLTAAIIENYRNSSDSQSQPEKQGAVFLPDKTAVIDVVNIIRKLLFPGYFIGDNAGFAAHTEIFVGNLLMQAEKILSRQICRALSYNCEENSDDAVSLDRAQKLCGEFLNAIPKMRDTLMTDVQAAFDGDPAARDKHEIIATYPGVFAISVYRMAHELFMLSVPLIPRMMTEYAHSLTGIDIHPGAEIDEYFFIDHGTGIVIGETTKIGKYAKIYQGVTLGALSTKGGQQLRGKKRHPTIEDEVTIYASASILGGETIIGKGSVIGGNAFITQSVPPYTRISVKCPQLDAKEIKKQ